MTRKTQLNKLPMVTALFWFIKIVATTLGESVSNYFAITPLKLGYAVSAGIFVVLFAGTLVAQSPEGELALASDVVACSHTGA
jgi:uncharacterized membrane-anchored protein